MAKCKKTLALLLALVMLLALVACGGSSAGDSGAATENTVDDTAVISESTEEHIAATTVTIGSTDSNFVGHFDSGGAFSMENSYPASYLVYDNALYVDPYTGEWASDILKSWGWSDETENLMVLTLRDDVYFASGDQMTGEDLYYSLYRVAESANFVAYNAYVDWDVSGVSADDPMVVELQFNRPYGAYQAVLRNAIVNKSWIEEHGGEDGVNWFDPAQIDGSGPYKPVDFVQDISTTYELRDDWWMADEAAEREGYCQIPTIITKKYSDQTSMMVDYENRKLDAVVNISASNYDMVVADSSLGTAATAPSNCVAVVAMGVDRNAAFDNMNLRKAICYGTDSDSIAAAVYGSLGSPARSTLSSTNAYFVDGYTYEYDPTAAMEYLQAYYDETGESSVDLTIVDISGNSSAEVAELFAAYMEAIGINVDLSVYEQGVTVTQYWTVEGATDLQVNGAGQPNIENDASTAYEFYEASGEFYALSRTGDEINDLINDGLFTTDDTERAEAYAAIQQYFYDNYELVPISEWMMAYAYHDTLSSLDLVAVTRPNLRFMG